MKIEKRFLNIFGKIWNVDQTRQRISKNWWLREALKSEENRWLENIWNLKACSVFTVASGDEIRLCREIFFNTLDLIRDTFMIWTKNSSRDIKLNSNDNEEEAITVIHTPNSIETEKVKV